MSTKTPAPAPELTEDEKRELELAEKARTASGSWDSVAPGKATNFGVSFRRLIGLLRPHAFAFAFVSLLGTISVVLTVAAPKVLGEATNIIFEGFISAQLPPGTTKAEAVEGLRAAGQNDLANLVSAMQITPGEGVDFARLTQVLVLVLALYIVASVLGWLQGYVINVIMVRTMWRLREAVEARSTACRWRTSTACSEESCSAA